MTKFEVLPAVVTLLTLESLVGFEALLAYRDRFLTAAQMTSKGVNHGLPFVWHFGTWGDIIIISPLVAVAIGMFWTDWPIRSLALSFFAGSIVAILLNWSYTWFGGSDAFVQQHNLTPSGYVHFIYMSLCLFILIQLFLFTPNVSPAFLRISGILVVTHVFLGTHMAFGIIQKYVSFAWYSDFPLQSANGWTIVGAVSVMVFIRAFL